MDPFLPWPGSKAKCSKEIISEFPESFNTYHEPFLGSGAIFFALNNYTSSRAFGTARLSDINKNLINCWKAVMDRTEHVKLMLGHCLERNSEDFYNAMRSQMSNPSVFLYVMRAAFSSMYRENLKGEFNVPWRKQDFEKNGKRISFDMERLDVCARYLRGLNVELMVAEWIDAIQSAKAGDLVYLDPPYVPYTGTSFTDYAAGGFGKGQHLFMAAQAKIMARNGVHVFMSNSHTEETVRIYGEPSKLLQVANSVKSTATEKGTRAEGLWIWRPN